MLASLRRLSVAAAARRWRWRRPRAPAAVPARASSAHANPGPLRVHDDFLELSVGSMRMHLDFLWLRDHCRSPTSFNVKTHQRNLDTAGVDFGIRPQQARLDGDRLELTWPDGHVTEYSLSWLAENTYEGGKDRAQPRALWDAAAYAAADVPAARWSALMSGDDEELRILLHAYLLYGVAFVSGVPASVEATEAVARRVSLIRETTYGRMWCFTSDFSRGDTAYSQLALDRHTDTSYFQEPCGIQVFHCLKHEGTGGRTLLVDGFHAAESLRRRAAEDFEILCRVPIRHEYLERSERHRNHMSAVGPLLSVFPWNSELYMVRYNNYDRAVIDTVPRPLVRRWYEAHRQFTAELRRPENELWVKLSPGTVIFIDNWRVLHGREAFTGVRQLCGCYLTRDDVLSAARGLGLRA